MLRGGAPSERLLSLVLRMHAGETLLSGFGNAGGSPWFLTVRINTARPSPAPGPFIYIAGTPRPVAVRCPLLPGTTAMQSRAAALITLIATASLAATAHAQWTVTNLRPAGATYSEARAANGRQQVGYAEVGGVYRASLWSGTAASWVDLNPAGSDFSAAWAVSGGQQAGSAVIDGLTHASLWSGTAASWVSLHPAGSTWSDVTAASGGQQVGSVKFGGLFDNASLWSGTAASWINLNPAGSIWSYATAVSGGQQVGFVMLATDHACLWSGTAASWIDLNPAGASGSRAQAVSGGQQAGYATMSGVQRASLWRGTAASWVDLNPALSTSSQVWAASGGQQVGGAVVGGRNRASLWSGTAASWVDLSAFLPAGFTHSTALGISSDGVHTYVCGYGYNSVAGRNEALLWTRPLPCPADLDNDGDFANGLTGDGAVTIEDLLSFLVGFEAGNVLVDLDNGTNTGTPDNAVDINDLLFFLARFEAGC